MNTNALGKMSCQNGPFYVDCVLYTLLANNPTKKYSFNEIFLKWEDMYGISKSRFVESKRGTKKT